MKLQSTKGIVLIALLWVLAALSLIAVSFASTVRLELQVAGAASDAERAYFFARGAAEAVLYRLAYPDQDRERQKELFPYAGGMSHYWTVDGDLICHVAIFDEAGKIDLNAAEEEVLARVLESAGVQDPLRSEIARKIVEFREPARSSSEARVDDGSPHRPFHAVEELLLIPGVTKELLYGHPKRSENGETLEARGLIDLLTAYSNSKQVNINYAEPEVLAALPGMSPEAARSISEARAIEAFDSGSDLSQRISGIVSSEGLSALTTQFSGRYCLVATAMVKGSKVRRSVKVVAKPDDTSPRRLERFVWYDEYWPSAEVLNWIERPQSRDSISS
ncbi:MAG: type II secretion system protein GspK [Acidobacteriota bacterium]